MWKSTKPTFFDYQFLRIDDVLSDFPLNDILGNYMLRETVGVSVIENRGDLIEGVIKIM